MGASHRVWAQQRLLSAALMLFHSPIAACSGAHLSPPPPHALLVLLQVTQLNWRLTEGGGEAIYCLGVEDNGHTRGLERSELEASLEVLRSMAAEVGAGAEVLRVSPGGGKAPGMLGANAGLVAGGSRVQGWVRQRRCRWHATVLD